MSPCKTVLAQLADQTSKLHQCMFVNYWDSKSFLSLFLLPTTKYIITENSLLVYSQVLDEVEILTVGVLPENRGQGLASTLFENLFAQDIYRIFLEVAKNNTPAIALYEKLGFVKIGVRENYYNIDGQLIDAICYEKIIRR